MDERQAINTLIIFNPNDYTPNTLKTSFDIYANYFNIPTDINSTYGSFVLYDPIKVNLLKISPKSL